MCTFSFGFSSPSQPPVSLSGNTSRRRPAQNTIFYRCAGLNLRESPKNQSLVLFNMRMHIKTWGLDGWQQWSSPSDFENLDFFSLVCHVVHSSGWIDLPVCGLQMYHLEISWSCTFSKQMWYQWQCNMYSVYFKVASQCTYVCVCVPPLPFLPRIATRTLLLCALCTVRSVHWEIEQPASSTFVHFPYLKWIIRVLQNFVAISIHRLWGSQKESMCDIYSGTYWWTIIDIQIYNSVPASWMYPTPKPKFAQMDGLVWLSHSKVNHCDRDHAWASSIIVREPVAIMTVPHTSGSGQVGFTRNSPSRTGWSCA